MERRIPSPIAKLHDEKGAALIVVVMMLMGLAALGMAASWIGSTDLVVAGSQRERSEALNLAEAGLAEAMHRLSQSNGTTATVGGAEVDISISDPADPPNPNWRARIFATSPGGAPAPSGADEFHTGTLQPSGAYLEYSHASDEDLAINIRHKLRDFDGDGTSEVALYDPSRVPPENPNTGSPIERITVTGIAGTAERSIQADVIRFPIMANVFSALASDREVDLRGDVSICGRNHSINTPMGSGLPNCSPAWDEPNGHLPGVMTTDDPIGAQGSVDLLGNPSPTDTRPTNNFLSIAETLGLTELEWVDFRAQADRTTLTGSGPWDGFSIIEGDVSLSGGSGSGLLYVNGNLRISGGFEWTGLVYVEGTLQSTGDNFILGGAMVRGGNESVAVDFGAGTPGILFSRQALVQALMSSADYIVLSWKEVD